MNITDNFICCLKTIKRNEEKVNEILCYESNSESIKEKKRFDFNKSKINEFNRNAKDLVKSITDMKNYLLHNRKDYINI